MNVIEQIEKEQMDKLLESKSVPEFAAGDTIRVDYKVVEGERERIQAFEGVCIGRNNAGLNSTFTVRKIASGEGVERIFPVYSPNVAGIEIIRRGDVRRAKLYYLRGRTGKSARIAEKTTGYAGKLTSASKAEALAVKKAANAAAQAKQKEAKG